VPTDLDVRPILVVIGPPGSGKSNALRELAQRDILRVHPTWTTRPGRADEHDGEIEHRFVSDAEFDAREADGFFLGTVTRPGSPYRDALPGVVPTDDGPIDTFMTRAPFVDALRQSFPYQVVYQIEDTPQRAKFRLIERGVDAAELVEELGCYAEEARAGRALAQRVFTNDASLDELVDAVTKKLQIDAGLPTLDTDAAVL
jgi:guanylate kinase